MRIARSGVFGSLPNNFLNRFNALHGALFIANLRLDAILPNSEYIHCTCEHANDFLRCYCVRKL